MAVNPRPDDGDPAVYTFDPATFAPLSHTASAPVDADTATTSLIPAAADAPPSPAADDEPDSTPGLLPPIRLASPPAPGIKRVTGTLPPEPAPSRSVFDRRPAPMPAFTAPPAAPPEPFVTAPMPRYDDRPEPEPADPPQLTAGTRSWDWQEETRPRRYLTARRHALESDPPSPAAGGPGGPAADPLDLLDPALSPAYAAACRLHIADALEKVVRGDFGSFDDIRHEIAEHRAAAASLAPSIASQS